MAAQHRFFNNFRLLPATLVVVMVVFGVRVFDAVSLLLGGDAVPAVQTAQAQTKAPPASAIPKTEAAAAKPVQSAEPPAALPAPAPGGAAAAKDKPVQNAAATALAAPKQATDPRRPAPETNLSSAEVELLQTLAARRNELDQRAQTVEQREALLKVGEDRMNQKVAELAALKADIEKLLSMRKSKEEAELNNLVKIYEAMKPREAATIFDGLDMPVLLDVVEKMKDQKIAPIFAQMKPERAREVTARLAERRKLPPTPPPSALQPASFAAPLPQQPMAAPPAQAQPASATAQPPAAPAAKPGAANNKK
jgi:flagellar motility protein MotE (MotC chaperone)